MTSEGKQRIRILFVGLGAYEIYESAFHNAALTREDCFSEQFSFVDYLERIKPIVLQNLENKLSFGWQTSRFNSDLIKYCRNNSVDMVFFYNAKFVFSNTIKMLKEDGKYVAVYCNDDPFSCLYPRYYWKHVIASMKYADMVYVYRKQNVKEALAAGAGRCSLLRSYYISRRNFYIPDEQIAVDVPEIVFIGHYEKDERQECLEELLRNGISVGLPEHAWKGRFAKGSAAYLLSDTNDSIIYNQILNKAKIALVFLSRLNRDTYTRRCFEIPAAKTMMLSEYTDDLASLYKEDEEIVFFRNKKELVEKAKYYLNHDKERQVIAENGYQRLIRDGHEAGDRVSQIIKDYKQYASRMN